MISQRNSQNGSTLAFVIVGVLLAAAVIGGVMLARQRGQVTAVNDTKVAQEDKKAADNKPASDKTDTDKKKAEEKAKQDTAAKEKAQKEADKKAAEQKAARDKATKEAEAKAAAEKATNAEQSEGDGPMARDTANTTTANGGLPTTGPTEDLIASGVGLVAIFAASYIYYTYGRKS